MIPSCMEYGKYNLYFGIGFAYLSYHISSYKNRYSDSTYIYLFVIFSYLVKLLLQFDVHRNYKKPNLNANGTQIRSKHYKIHCKCRLKYTIQM